MAQGGAFFSCAANVANADAYTAATYGVGDMYVALPRGCTYDPVGAIGYYGCNGAWFEPHYGANGVYDRVVPAP